MHKPFTLYRRPTRKKKRYVYYAQFRDENGNRMTAVSSGKTTRADAEPSLLGWILTLSMSGNRGKVSYSFLYRIPDDSTAPSSYRF